MNTRKPKVFEGEQMKYGQMKKKKKKKMLFLFNSYIGDTKNPFITDSIAPGWSLDIRFCEVSLY